MNFPPGKGRYSHLPQILWDWSSAASGCTTIDACEPVPIVNAISAS